jgi:hypothetical protein
LIQFAGTDLHLLQVPVGGCQFGKLLGQLATVRLQGCGEFRLGALYLLEPSFERAQLLAKVSKRFLQAADIGLVVHFRVGGRVAYRFQLFLELCRDLAFPVDLAQGPFFGGAQTFLGQRRIGADRGQLLGEVAAGGLDGLLEARLFAVGLFQLRGQGCARSFLEGWPGFV